ncbi:MAG: HK97 family phage prohead protease [Eubacterium sp.]
MQHRMLELKDFKTRSSENGNPIIEGYFSKFNEEYQICSDWIEVIRPGAFRNFLATNADVKILWNHNTDIVLGSRSNGTLVLNEDEIGLYGSCEINQNDTEAMNCYERIKRGDITGCSFGFDIKEFNESIDENEIYRTEILEVNPLYEVSPCTFPAYESTEIYARNKENIEIIRSKHKKRNFELWKKGILSKLHKED